MKKKILLILVICIPLFLSACGFAKKGRIYITDETSNEKTLFMVKTMPIMDNSSHHDNIFDQHIGTVNYGGYTWRIYEVGVGGWDIYIEYWDNGDIENDRESVNIADADDPWGALWLIEDNVYWVNSFEGIGAFSLAGHPRFTEN